MIHTSDLPHAATYPERLTTKAKSYGFDNVEAFHRNYRLNQLHPAGCIKLYRLFVSGNDAAQPRAGNVTFLSGAHLYSLLTYLVFVKLSIDVKVALVASEEKHLRSRLVSDKAVAVDTAFIMNVPQQPVLCGRKTRKPYYNVNYMR